MAARVEISVYCGAFCVPAVGLPLEYFEGQSVAFAGDSVADAIRRALAAGWRHIDGLWACPACVARIAATAAPDDVIWDDPFRVEYGPSW
jgi:hypothetical protein